MQIPRFCCLETLCVHALSFKENTDIPFGGSFRGVNFYGVALWGMVSCLLFQEIYCQIVLLLASPANSDKSTLLSSLVPGVLDLVPLTAVAYFGFWSLVLLVLLGKILTSPPPRYSLNFMCLRFICPMSDFMPNTCFTSRRSPALAALLDESSQSEDPLLYRFRGQFMILMIAVGTLN